MAETQKRCSPLVPHPGFCLSHGVGTPVPSLAPLCSCPAGLGVWAAPGPHSTRWAPGHSSSAWQGGNATVLPHPAACNAWQGHGLGCPAHSDLRGLPIRRRFYRTIGVLQIVRWNPSGSEYTGTPHKLSNGVSPSAAVSRGTSPCMQDFGCQACKNILCERNGGGFHSTFG